MDLVEALGAELQTLGRGIHAEPKIGGSIMRINRDIRFSKDKRPYKDHLNLWFWKGRGPSRALPGYWFRLTPTRLMLGAGMHDFGARADFIDRYRAAVVEPKRGAALAKAVGDARAAGYDLGGQAFKRVPKGFDPGHPRAELLLHGGLYAGVDLAVPKELHTPRLPAFCVKHYRKLSPLVDWLAPLIRS